MMNANDYIISKQVSWAANNGLELIGSKVTRGRKTYTKSLEENLFVPLAPETAHEIRRGDGNELSGYPCKMQAVHSSSALGVNVFDYWKSKGEFDTIAMACGLSIKSTAVSKDVVFEGKHPIFDQFVSPNIDVVGEEGYRHSKEISKFTEIVKADGINFLSLSYQDLIIRLMTKYRGQHPKYVDYLSSRYL